MPVALAGVYVCCRLLARALRASPILKLQKAAKKAKKAKKKAEEAKRAKRAQRRGVRDDEKQ